MDVQHFLAVNTMVISALAIIMSMMQTGTKNNLLWLAVNGLVVATGLVAMYMFPRSAGTIVSAVFCPLVMAPFLLSNLTQRAMLKGNLRSAALFGQVLAVLHPTRHVRLNSALTGAHARATPAEQVAALQTIAADASPAERIAIQGHMLWANNDWQGLLDHFRAHRDEIVSVGSLEVRALGELGRTEEMLAAYENTKLELNGFDLQEAQLFVLAYGGRPAEVAVMLQGSLAGLGEEAKAYWTAIASRASGAAAQDWQTPLRKAADASRNATFKARAARQLAMPAHVASETLSPRALSIIDATAHRVTQVAPVKRNWLLAAPLTYLLLALIVAVYAMEELRGGSEDLRVLVDMGAMWPPYVERRGEWWRLGTALFLHLGPLHTGVNALMLYVLGRPCEQSYGSLRMLVIYVLGGLASSGFVLWLALSGYAEPAVLIGASGAIMGLFGALVARRLVSWLRYRDPVDRRTLVLLPAILLLQLAADLSSPQVSLAAHASGFVAGLLIGMVLSFATREARTPS